MVDAQKIKGCFSFSSSSSGFSEPSRHDDQHPTSATMPATPSTQFALVVALALSAVAVSADDMVLLKPPAGASGPQVGLIMIQGAQSPAKSYAPLYEKLQQLTANKYSLYVAIPAFYFSTPQPIQISSKISEAQKAMKSAGLGSDAPLFVAGHSLGTVFLQVSKTPRAPKSSYYVRTSLRQAHQYRAARGSGRE